MVGQRIVVSTYCSTTYLESIAANIPTIVFWDPSYSNLLPLARSYIDVLENAGMFHNSARSAAEFVAMIWDDVGTWWESADVVMARRTFSSQYCHMPKGVSSVVKEALRSVVDSPGEYS
jgi:putative transferase (TIGR04331 family)|tara:strand:- start:92 stop:448 length:357 start_codon:yes stop_codon:yes gene_type:complete